MHTSNMKKMTNEHVLLTDSRKHFEAKVEHENDMLDYSIITNRGMNG